jgi:hypothetical protein
MYSLWNNLFGFPVNQCQLEATSCDHQYIPVLNWDEDNGFVWSLVDPFG